MAWEKPAAELVARFDACLPPAPGVDRRRMFGCPCAFVNGNMFAGVHEQRIILRLPEAQRAQLVARGEAGPFTVRGRTMREYVALGDALARPAEAVAELVGRAYDYARALPPKLARRNTQRIQRKAAAPGARG